MVICVSPQLEVLRSSLSPLSTGDIQPGSHECQTHPLFFVDVLKALLPLPACIPNASYDYMTASASDHIRSLTLLPGSASHLRFCKTAHSHVDVCPSIPNLAHECFLGVALGCVPRPWSHVSLCPWQEPCLLEDGSSVTNCLLEGAVRLAAGSVIQHCHLQVHD